MDIAEAIRTAIDFETKVRALYAGAALKAADPSVKKTLDTLALEEQHHLDYLASRLEEWTRTGRLTAEALSTAVPTRQAVAERLKTVKARLQVKPADRENLLAVLRAAQAAETETGGFYQKMVADLPGEARKMFARFVEIEQGHLALVTAELDSVAGLGFWFDLQEFRLEAE